MTTGLDRWNRVCECGHTWAGHSLLDPDEGTRCFECDCQEFYAAQDVAGLDRRNLAAGVGEARPECHICHRPLDEPGELWCSAGHPIGTPAEELNKWRGYHATDVGDLSAEVARLREQLDAAMTALKWYAERRNYTPPAGMTVGGIVTARDGYDGGGPGARARAALKVVADE